MSWTGPNRREALRHAAVRFGSACIGASWFTRESGATTWPSEWRQNTINVHADFSLARLVPLIRATSVLCRTVPHTLNLSPSSESIQVYLFQRKDTFEQYLSHHFPTAPTRRALFVKQQGPGMVFAFDSAELATDLRHETTHAVLHTLLPIVPLWLDEGLAEYFEVAANARIRGNPHLTHMQRQLRWKRAPNLAALEAITDLGDMNEKQYRNAWAWVHFLLHGPPLARHLLLQHVAEINHQSVPTSLSRKLTHEMPRWSTAFRQHFASLT